jgi:hypothetical protein
MVTRPSWNRTSRANESIPSLRHRAKTAPQEQSIRFPLLDGAQENSMKLRIVCPFAKDYLARHPELKERYSALSEAALESESLFGSVKADGS